MSAWAKEHDPQALAGVLRTALAGRRGVKEKRMFGGVCFLLRGNMLCGSGGPGFMFRVGKEAHAAALKRKGASEMTIRGRVFEGFVWVDPAACKGSALKGLVALAERHAGRLPEKSRVRKTRKKRDVRVLKGSLHKPSRPVSLQEMSRAVRRRVAERTRR